VLYRRRTSENIEVEKMRRWEGFGCGSGKQKKSEVGMRKSECGSEIGGSDRLLNNGNKGLGDEEKG
jgi:hypothetical protein